MSDEYLELVERFPLEPIRDEDHLERAMEVLFAAPDEEDMSEAEQSYYGTLDTLCGAFEESTLAFGLALSTDAVVDVLGGLKSMCGTEQQLQELREGLPLLLSDDDAEVEKGRAVVDELFDEYDSMF